MRTFEDEIELKLRQRTKDKQDHLREIKGFSGGLPNLQGRPKMLIRAFNIDENICKRGEIPDVIAWELELKKKQLKLLKLRKCKV